MSDNIQALRRMVLIGGLSRNSLIFHLVPELRELCRGATSTENPTHHPWDDDDLSRCREAAEAITGFSERLPQMASVSTFWAVVAREWDNWGRLREEEKPLLREYYKLGPRQKKAAVYPGLVYPAMKQAYDSIPEGERDGWKIYAGVAVKGTLPPEAVPMKRAWVE